MGQQAADQGLPHDIAVRIQVVDGVVDGAQGGVADGVAHLGVEAQGVVVRSSALPIYVLLIYVSWQFTVHEIHCDCRTKTQSRPSGNRSVPWIQMKNHWLRKAGFEIQKPIKVRVMDGCLVLATEE